MSSTHNTIPEFEQRKKKIDALHSELSDATEPRDSQAKENLSAAIEENFNDLDGSEDLPEDDQACDGAA